MWGVIKHKKDQYVDLLKMEDDVQGELSLHHDFSTNTVSTMVRMVQDIEYLLKVCNPLKGQVVLKNILTGEITVTNANVDKFLCCIKEGNFACANL